MPSCSIHHNDQARRADSKNSSAKGSSSACACARISGVFRICSPGLVIMMNLTRGGPGPCPVGVLARAAGWGPDLGRFTQGAVEVLTADEIFVPGQVDDSGGVADDIASDEAIARSAPSRKLHAPNAGLLQICQLLEETRWTGCWSMLTSDGVIFVHPTICGGRRPALRSREWQPLPNTHPQGNAHRGI